MNIEALSQLNQSDFIPPIRANSFAGGEIQQSDKSFGSLVSDGLNSMNQQLMIGQTDLQKLATGDVQNLHQVMIRMEETRMNFQLMMQVRNRLLEAYQDVMKMSV